VPIDEYLADLRPDRSPDRDPSYQKLIKTISRERPEASLVCNGFQCDRGLRICHRGMIAASKLSRSVTNEDKLPRMRSAEPSGHAVSHPRVDHASGVAANFTGGIGFSIIGSTGSVRRWFPICIGGLLITAGVVAVPQ